MNRVEIIELLRELSQELYEQEYRAWYNANTMRSFEEWRSCYAKTLIDCANTMIDELDSE